MAFRPVYPVLNGSGVGPKVVVTEMKGTKTPRGDVRSAVPIIFHSARLTLIGSWLSAHQRYVQDHRITDLISASQVLRVYFQWSPALECL